VFCVPISVGRHEFAAFEHLSAQRKGAWDCFMGVKHQLLRTANKFVAALPGPRLPTHLHGQTVWLARDCWQTVYSRYEPHMASAIKESLPSGGTFWDVGANIGLFSLYASKIVGPGGRVLSFEPSPDVLTLLRSNVEGNGNITVMPCGIGNTDGVASFAAHGASSSASFVQDVTAINRDVLPEQPIEQVTVEIRKLDTILESNPPPNLVKIDVEGFEFEALKGADRLLAIRPKLLIEIHPPQLALSGGSEGAVFEYLQQRSYKWTVIDRNPNSLYSVLCSPR
jgi:FkbM family methyltransferase